jgi:hypothetical protein
MEHSEQGFPPNFPTARWLLAGPNLHRPDRFDGWPKPVLLADVSPIDRDFCRLLSRRGASCTGRFTILAGQVQVVCPSVGNPDSEADAARARCSADRVRGNDPMQVDGAETAPHIGNAAGLGSQAPVEDYQTQSETQRQTARAVDSGASVQQGLLDKIARQREAFAELHAMMLYLQQEVQQQKQGDQLATATQGLKLQTDQGNRLIPLAELQPGLEPTGAELTPPRGAGARQDEEQQDIGYGENFEDLSQEIFPFGFPILSQETPLTNPQQGSDPESLNLKGVINQLSIMYTPPIDFEAMEEFDLFSRRPRTQTSDWVSTLQSLGLDPHSNIQHCFFVKCYMNYLTSPDFCSEGNFEPLPFWLDQPAGPAHPPQSSILKKRPRKMMELFFFDAQGPRVSDTRNRDFATNTSGLASFRIPEVVIEIVHSIVLSNTFLSSSTNLTQQIVTYLQHEF